MLGWASSLLVGKMLRPRWHLWFASSRRRQIGDRGRVVDDRDEDKVCVVGATTAWPFYRLTGAYVCQENRYIQEDSGRLGFYSSRLIHGAAPLIRAIYPSVDLYESSVAHLAMHTDPEMRRVGLIAEAALQQGALDAAVQVVLLTSIDDPDTALFEPVRHEGKGAWTQRQRYTRLHQLRAAATTDDLVTADQEGE